MDRSDNEGDLLEQLAAIIRYELLWNIRKKKVIVMFLITLGIASLSIFLPTIIGSTESDPNFFIKNLNPDGLILILLAIVVSMNSISGEFEDGTIEPLASKSISRARIYLGKVLAMVILLLGIYFVLELYMIGGGYLIYGSQNGLNLSLVAIPFLLTISTMVWVSVSLVFGSITKSSMVAAIGTIGIFFALAIGGGIVTSLASQSGGTLNYVPGSGESGNVPGQFSQEITVEGISVSTGTNIIAKQLVLYSHDSSAEVRIRETELSLENAEQGGSPIREVGYHSYSMSHVFWRSLLVSIAYIFGLSVLAWYSFKRSDISIG